MSQFLKFPISGGVRVAHAIKDRAAGKRSALVEAPQNIDPGASGGGLILESVNRAKDDVDHNYDNEGGIEVKSPPTDHSLEP
nr:hypothetical protein [Tanacetum cinerariifolium]